MIREALLDHIHLAHGQIHRIEGELIPDEAAVRYADNIRDAFKLQPHELPVFDVIQRGMGPDTHTASLFPGEPLIENVTGIAAAVWVEKMKQHRVTLLRGVLERARQTFMLVSGADKAEALMQVLTGPPDFMQHPCQIASDRAEWFVDEAAPPTFQRRHPRPDQLATACRKLFRSASRISGSPGATLFNRPSRIHCSSRSTKVNRWSKPSTMNSSGW